MTKETYHVLNANDVIEYGDFYVGLYGDLIPVENTTLEELKSTLGGSVFVLVRPCTNSQTTTIPDHRKLDV